jgi:murein endopeptidase
MRLVLALFVIACGVGTPADDREPGPRIHYRDSVAIGLPSAGSLVRGVKVPPYGAHFFTWDPIQKQRPNRPWRRWATGELVRSTLRIARQFRRDHPAAPRLGIGDLSRPEGGDFGPRFGGIGHASHQNGLDVDVYYPRLDRAESAPLTVSDVDRALAQDLVDRFVAAGAVRVFVGPSLGLDGPTGIVVPLANHDNHLHARFAF